MLMLMRTFMAFASVICVFEREVALCTCTWKLCTHILSSIWKHVVCVRACACSRSVCVCVWERERVCVCPSSVFVCARVHYYLRVWVCVQAVYLSVRAYIITCADRCARWTLNISISIVCSPPPPFCTPCSTPERALRLILT